MEFYLSADDVPRRDRLEIDDRPHHAGEGMAPGTEVMRLEGPVEVNPGRRRDGQSAMSGLGRRGVRQVQPASVVEHQHEQVNLCVEISAAAVTV